MINLLLKVLEQIKISVIEIFFNFFFYLELFCTVQVVNWSSRSDNPPPLLDITDRFSLPLFWPDKCLSVSHDRSRIKCSSPGMSPEPQGTWAWRIRFLHPNPIAERRGRVRLEGEAWDRDSQFHTSGMERLESRPVTLHSVLQHCIHR